jgi:hypothetical protein
VPYEATDDERDVFEKGAPSMQTGWTGTLDKLESYLAGASSRAAHRSVQ